MAERSLLQISIQQMEVDHRKRGLQRRISGGFEPKGVVGEIVPRGLTFAECQRIALEGGYVHIRGRECQRMTIIIYPKKQSEVET